MPSATAYTLGTHSSIPFRDQTNFGLNGAHKFPNPFYDVASEFIPTDINNVFEWCEYIYTMMGTWRSASRRVVRYFLTDIVLEGESDEEREDYQDFLDDDMHLLTELAQIGDDFMTYGNVFVSLYFPFDRFLICPKCHFQYHTDALPYRYNASALQFISTCKKCQHHGAFHHEDRRSPNRKAVKIIRWNPKQIRMRVHPVSGRTVYYWEIPMEFSKKIREGKHFYIKDTPWKILECFKTGNQSQMPLFEFSEDAIYHFKETTLAGLPIVGWGIPPILPNFKLAYYIQVLRRFDEAIAHDYIVPFRILYPDYGPSPHQDPLAHFSNSQFVAQMQSFVQAHRLDPSLVQIAPFKVGYEMVGGEGNQLTPKDQIAQAIDELLNSLGYPAELYKGSLSIQSFPVALRLFEKTWGSLTDGYNDLIRWMLTKISRHFMWGDITGKLRSVTLADDLERKALSLQGAAGMDISKHTAYQPFGIDYMEEQRRVVEEQQAIQELQQEAMAEAQAQQGLEGGASGGGGGGAGVGATPGDVNEQAKQLAQTLLYNTPETLRRGELIKIKHSNPTLHALVLQEMDTMRQDMNRQGGAMMMEQMKGQGGPGGGMVAQASADESVSPLMVGWLIADQLLGYDHTDMKKLAASAKNGGGKAAEHAFRFVYSKKKGWS